MGMAALRAFMATKACSGGGYDCVALRVDIGANGIRCVNNGVSQPASRGAAVSLRLTLIFLLTAIRLLLQRMSRGGCVCLNYSVFGALSATAVTLTILYSADVARYGVAGGIAGVRRTDVCWAMCLWRMRLFIVRGVTAA